MHFSAKYLLPILVLVTPTAWAEPLRVVASFSILADMVKNVGGEDITVTTLVGVDGDAHVYEPTPADVKAVGNSQLVIVNGLAFEGWIERLLKSSAYQGEVVVASQGVAPRHMQEEAEHESKGGKQPYQGHDQHEHGSTDPHAWQNLANGQIYVTNIINGLVKADPAHAAAYQQRGAAYLAQLKATDQWVREQLAAVPPARRRVITSHDTFGYFGIAYGVEFLAPVGWTTKTSRPPNRSQP